MQCVHDRGQTIRPPAARVYEASLRGLAKLLELFRSCHAGLWLGVLSRDQLHAVDRWYYDANRKYFQDGYNRQGLWGWEESAIDAYFGDCRTLVVGGAGGGREVLALRRRGFTVDGFECHPGLVEQANRLLSHEGFPCSVRPAARDECPEMGQRYDGAIVGWGAYMLIRGRARRVAFLQALRHQVRDGGPVLVSFFDRAGEERRFRVVAAIGNIVRRLFGREAVELGDDLDPNYAHSFTRAEIEAELEAAGFQFIMFQSREYGHAVGKAFARDGETARGRSALARAAASDSDGGRTPGRDGAKTG